MGWFKNLWRKGTKWATGKLSTVGWYWIKPDDGDAFIGRFFYAEGKPNLNVHPEYEPRFAGTPQSTWRFFGPLKEPKS